MLLQANALRIPLAPAKHEVDAEFASGSDMAVSTTMAFGRLLARYRDVYNPGPDVGTSDADMKTIAIENGLDEMVKSLASGK